MLDEVQVQMMKRVVKGRHGVFGDDAAGVGSAAYGLVGAGASVTKPMRLRPAF